MSFSTISTRSARSDSRDSRISIAEHYVLLTEPARAMLVAQARTVDALATVKLMECEDGIVDALVKGAVSVGSIVARMVTCPEKSSCMSQHMILGATLIMAVMNYRRRRYIYKYLAEHARRGRAARDHLS